MTLPPLQTRCATVGSGQLFHASEVLLGEIYRKPGFLPEGGFFLAP